jgi:hypothetical protein
MTFLVIFCTQISSRFFGELNPGWAKDYLGQSLFWALILPVSVSWVMSIRPYFSQVAGVVSGLPCSSPTCSQRSYLTHSSPRGEGYALRVRRVHVVRAMLSEFAESTWRPFAMPTSDQPLPTKVMPAIAESSIATWGQRPRICQKQPPPQPGTSTRIPTWNQYSHPKPEARSQIRAQMSKKEPKTVKIQNMAKFHPKSKATRAQPRHAQLSNRQGPSRPQPPSTSDM